MKAIKSFEKYKEELKKPFDESEKRQESLKNHIEKLENERANLDPSDIENLVEVKSKINTAQEMKQQEEENYEQMKHADEEALNRLHELRGDFQRESMKEAESIHGKIQEKVDELDELIKQFDNLCNEKNRELQQALNQFSPYVDVSSITSNVPIKSQLGFNQESFNRFKGSVGK